MTRWRRSFNRAFLPRKSNEETKVVGSNELLPSPLLESLFVTILGVGEPLRFRFVLEEVPRATDPTFPRSRNSRQSRPTLPSWLTALNSWTQDVSAPEQPPFVSTPSPPENSRDHHGDIPATTSFVLSHSLPPHFSRGMPRVSLLRFLRKVASRLENGRREIALPRVKLPGRVAR